MKIEYYEEMLEQEAINKYLNMIANDYNGELAKIFQEKYINKDKEIKKLHSIIKEVREYIEEKKYNFCDDYDLRCEDGKEILEILDKENK